MLELARTEGVLSVAEIEQIQQQALFSKKEKAGTKNSESKVQGTPLLREITSMTSGYVPMAQQNSWMLPLFDLAKQFVDEEKHRLPKVYRAFQKYEQKLRGFE